MLLTIYKIIVEYGENLQNAVADLPQTRPDG